MIHTIIFDFGNIFLDLDYPEFNSQLQHLLDFDLAKDPLPETVSNIFMQYEMGLCNEDDIMAVLNKFRPGVEKADFKMVWNSLLVGIPKHRLDWLKNLSKQYPLALLSNINNWHRQWADDHLQTVHGISQFERTYFSNYFYSYEIGMRKPNNDIYEHVTKELALPTEQLLFIDDTLVNVETASKLNWKAQCHNPKDDIVSKFPSYLSAL